MIPCTTCSGRGYYVSDAGFRIVCYRCGGDGFCNPEKPIEPGTITGGAIGLLTVIESRFSELINDIAEKAVGNAVIQKADILRACEELLSNSSRINELRKSIREIQD